MFFSRYALSKNGMIYMKKKEMKRKKLFYKKLNIILQIHKLMCYSKSEHNKH